MLCRRYSAEQALEMGLVNAVVDDDALEATVDAWVAELAALSPATWRSPRSAPTSGGTPPGTRSCTGLGMLTQAVGSADMAGGRDRVPGERSPFPDPAERLPGPPIGRLTVAAERRGWHLSSDMSRLRREPTVAGWRCARPPCTPPNPVGRTRARQRRATGRLLRKAVRPPGVLGRADRLADLALPVEASRRGQSGASTRMRLVARTASGPLAAIAAASSSAAASALAGRRQPVDQPHLVARVARSTKSPVSAHSMASAVRDPRRPAASARRRRRPGPRRTSGRPNVASVGGDDQVAGQHDLEPARDGVPLDGRDERLVRRLLDDAGEAAHRRSTAARRRGTP